MHVRRQVNIWTMLNKANKKGLVLMAIPFDIAYNIYLRFKGTRKLKTLINSFKDLG